MKKLLIILFCAVLVCLSVLPVFAATGSVALTPSAKEINPGDTFTVAANLTNSEKIQLCTVALEYDASALELLDGECLASDTMIGEVLPKQKAGTFMLKSKSALSGDVFSFTFRVLDNAPVGKVKISAKAAVGITSGEPISVTGCEVSVACKHVPGPAATEQAPQTCTVCGAELAPALTPKPSVSATEPNTDTTAETVGNTDAAAETTGAVTEVQPGDIAIPVQPPQVGDVVVQQTEPKNPGVSIGIVIGVFAAVAVITAAAILLWRKKKDDSDSK